MSMFKYVFDNEFMQRHDIESLRHSQQRAKSRRRQAFKKVKNDVDNLQAQIDELADQNAELELMCKVMMKLLLKHEILSAEEFHKTFMAMDLEDGKLDGKLSKNEEPEPEPVEEETPIKADKRVNKKPKLKAPKARKKRRI